MPRIFDCAGCGYPICLRDGEYVCDCELFALLDRTEENPLEQSGFEGAGMRTPSFPEECTSSLLRLAEGLELPDPLSDATQPELPSRRDTEDAGSTSMGGPNRSITKLHPAEDVD